MYELLFDDEISSKDEILFIEATQTLRKSVALKGFQNKKLINKMIDRVITLLKKTNYDFEEM